MIRRRTLVRCAALMVVMMGVSACAGIRLPRIPGLGGGRGGDVYQGTGTRVPVLALNQQLQPSAALQGVDFQLPPAQPVTAWPLPGGTPEQSVEHVVAAPAFEVAWRRNVGAGHSRRSHVTGMPVVAQGRIFTLDGRARVTALDERNGAEIWRVDLAPRSGRDRESYGGGVAFHNGLVIVASGFRFVTALDANTGAVRWRTAMASPIRVAPSVVDGRIFVIDVEDQLFALDAATGEITWNYQGLEEPARVLAASSAAVSGDVVVAPFASGELVALRAPNGTLLWQDTLSFTSRNNALSEIRDIAGRPVIYRGDVFAGSHSGLFGAVSLRDGQRRWELPIATITTPVAAGDVVYVVSQAGEVICIARESGQVYWTVNLNANARGRKDRAIWSGPLLASDRLVLVSDRGEAVALNPKNGARLKTIRIGGPAYLSPIAVNGTIYVLTNEANLIAIR